MNSEAVIYSPSIRPRLIRNGIPVLIFLVAVTAYLLLNAEMFERNADPDSISIPVAIVLLWVSVSVLAFVPLLMIGGTQLIVASNGFAFGGRLKGVYLNVEGAWHDVVAAEYKSVEMRNSGVFVSRAIFGLRVRQPNGEQFISLHHYRDQLRAGGRLGEHLRQVAPQVHAAIETALAAGRSVEVASAHASAKPEQQAGYWTTQAAQARQAGDYRAEAQAYRRAVELDPRDNRLYFYLANALVQAGQSDEAITVMQQGLNVRPTSSAMAFNIARTAQALGRAEQARTYYDLALVLAAKDPDLNDRKAFMQQVQAEMAAKP